MNYFHFIWIGKKEMPAYAISNIKKWLECLMYTDFQVYLWINKDVSTHNIGQKFSCSHKFSIKRIEKEFNSFLEFGSFYDYAYKSGLYPQACDYLRMLILNKYGGIYLDVDVSPSEKNLEYEKNMESVSSAIKRIKDGPSLFLGFRFYPDQESVTDVHIIFAFKQNVFKLSNFSFKHNWFAKKDEIEYQKTMWGKIFSIDNHTEKQFKVIHPEFRVFGYSRDSFNIRSSKISANSFIHALFSNGSVKLKFT